MSDIIRARLICVGMVLIGAGGTAWNWYHLAQTGRYYPMLALFGPCCALMFILFLFSPTLLAQPRERKAEIIVNSVAGIGMLLGALNWYLMVNSV